MNYAIISTDYFDKGVKSLAKKYHSLVDDLEFFKKELLKNPTMGSDLGNSIRKVRVAITSKNKGKRGGARIITCNMLVDVENTKIYLLAIYDKGAQNAISKKEIEHLKEITGFISRGK
jgi:hypothetical protein